MANLSDRLSRLGEQVSATSDALASTEQTLDQARQRLFHVPRRAPHPARPWLLAASAGALVVVTLVLSMSGRDTRGQRIAFEVGADDEGRVGHELEAVQRDLTLRFSEGSRLELTPQSRLTVTELGPDGAELVLGRGSARAAIAPGRAVEEWAFRAGPFRVFVTGTVFELSWDPTREHFVLDMREGSVLVSGPYLPDERKVVAGERLSVSLRDESMNLERVPVERKDERKELPTPTQAASDEDELTPSVKVRVEVPDARHEPNPSATEPAGSADLPEEPAGKSTPDQAEDFSELLNSSAHQHVIATAEARGFDQVASTLSLEQLYKLADAARFSGRPDLARQALLSARSRFGNPPRAAFLLGKVAADQHRDYAQAARWFETYLTEAPAGAFAEQALGRLIVLSRSTDPMRARTLARRYLEQYPSGAYSSAARELVGSPRN